MGSENVLGFSARGTLTASDYENVIIPAVEEHVSRDGKVRFLYHLGEEFTDFEAAAMWDDAKLGLRYLKLGLRNLEGWERMALVSDVEWIRAAVKVFGIVIPGHVRVFHNRDLADATRWVSGATTL